MLKLTIFICFILISECLSVDDGTQMIDSSRTPSSEEGNFSTKSTSTISVKGSSLEKTGKGKSGELNHKPIEEDYSSTNSTSTHSGKGLSLTKTEKHESSKPDSKLTEESNWSTKSTLRSSVKGFSLKKNGKSISGELNHKPSEEDHLSTKSTLRSSVKGFSLKMKGKSKSSELNHKPSEENNSSTESTSTNTKKVSAFKVTDKNGSAEIDSKSNEEDNLITKSISTNVPTKLAGDTSKTELSTSTPKIEASIKTTKISSSKNVEISKNDESDQSTQSTAATVEYKTVIQSTIAIQKSSNSKDEIENPSDLIEKSSLESVEINNHKGAQPGKRLEYDESKDRNSHFMIFLFLGLIVVIIGYILFQKRKKILGLLIEGKRTQRIRRPSSNKDSKVSYKPLETEDAEAGTNNFKYVY